MGRKRKFGEESDFVSVRVPKSKKQDYRDAIKNFVEKKFANESTAYNKDSVNKINRNELNGFRKFEEFIKDLRNKENEKAND